MMQVVKENLGFLIPFFWFLLGGAILVFFIEKGDAVLYFNENRTSFWTTFFCYFTKIGEEWSYVFFALAFAYFTSYKDSIRVGVVGFLTMIVSFGLKSFFAYPRPKTFFYQIGKLDEIILPEGFKIYQGLTAFPSGHTMSAFALFGFVALSLRGKNFAGLLLFCIAFLIGFSRTYLFQHFFYDVFAGAFLGVLIAIFVKYITQKPWFLPAPFWSKNFINRNN